MIITQKKPLEEVLAMVADAKTVAVIGCGLCASTCQTGGAPEVEAMKKTLEEAGKTVVLTDVADACCMKLGVRAKCKAISTAAPECIVCMSCGDGVQTIAKNCTGIPVYPANNTMFLGEVARVGIWEEACKMCGDCVLGTTGAICPITQCAKSLVNGPCGGQKNGKCEVNPENDCAWIQISSASSSSASSTSSPSPGRTRAMKRSRIPERSTRGGRRHEQITAGTRSRNIRRDRRNGPAEGL